MNMYMSKILFMHGLDSSKDSTKFHALDAAQKYCIDIDYRNLNYDTVAELYQNIIHKIQPKLIVGHSLGGYWALKMSQLFRIPAIIANPSLQPDFHTDYAPITVHDLEHDIPQTAYIELGDEILDMYETSNILESYMHVEMMQGGHHRLASPDNLNRMLEYMQKTFAL